MRKISVISPCYKMKKYLPKFLEDIPKQTCFNNLEIILDHNEPDVDEINLVNNFKKKYPGKLKHIVVDKVDPIGISMNRCIENSDGDFIAIWNVDDLRTPDSLERQAKTLDDGSVGVVFGDYIVVRKFGSTEGRKIFHSKYSESEFTRSMIFGPFFMFKRDLLKKSGFFDEQLKSGADFDLSIRLAFNAKAKVTDGILGYYLNEGLGASTRPGSLQAVERTIIELRYGIYDKIDYDLVPQALLSVSIPYIKQFGSWHPVSSFVPDYKKTLHVRMQKWYSYGIFSYAIKKYSFYLRAKRFLKSLVKEIYETYKKQD